jgi:hypothetical protein
VGLAEDAQRRLQPIVLADEGAQLAQTDIELAADAIKQVSHWCTSHDGVSHPRRCHLISLEM